LNKVQTIIEHAEQQCMTNGVRLTRKRKLILSSLLQSDKALSAYELVEYCKNRQNETIPAMSVYRILEFLQSQQLVHKLESANKYVACAHITCDGNHATSQFLICKQCQRVKEIDISDSVIQSLRQDVQDADFEVDNPQLEINGLCGKCGKKT
jgi:Fur family transcriptional regulator, zinc uptake regulator